MQNLLFQQLNGGEDYTMDRLSSTVSKSQLIRQAYNASIPDQRMLFGKGSRFTGGLKKSLPSEGGVYLCYLKRTVEKRAKGNGNEVISETKPYR